MGASSRSSDALKFVLALHGAGALVLVPSPERHAIHKLIVGSAEEDRDATAKSAKDRRQARSIIEAMTAKQADLVAAHTQA
ncbi:GSU2403 family nucleotidyltransferase fold protein [Bradyrhizobium macuxiense]|uniref:GSU2403 family nucleotidyltransferase fold protein n=1 Tax=Bradyrhizobium macuxiense TaxID=1755647 RepID=UPI001FF076CC|nr:GSU2403 family nucleotidyltransferase fold protein [Bradyrhizobium macuxiense]